MKSKIPYILLILIILASLVSYFYFVFDIGINSRYFIKRDFNIAFEARKTGNCSLFKEYVMTDQEEWGKRCLQEKDQAGLPIKNFIIKDVTLNNNSAFLQVELERDAYILKTSLATEGHELPEGGYLANYDMEKVRGNKFFVFLPSTKWVMKNEFR